MLIIIINTIWNIPVSNNLMLFFIPEGVWHLERIGKNLSGLCVFGGEIKTVSQITNMIIVFFHGQEWLCLIIRHVYSLGWGVRSINIQCVRFGFHISAISINYSFGIIRMTGKPT